MGQGRAQPQGMSECGAGGGIRASTGAWSTPRAWSILVHTTVLWWPQAEGTPAPSEPSLLCGHGCLPALHQDLLARRDPGTHPHGAAVKAREAAGNSCTREGLRVYCTHGCPQGCGERPCRASSGSLGWPQGLVLGTAGTAAMARLAGHCDTSTFGWLSLLSNDLQCTISPADAPCPAGHAELPVAALCCRAGTQGYGAEGS